MTLNSENSAKEDLSKRLSETTKERDLTKTWADELKEKFEKQEFSLKKQQEKMGHLESYKNYVVDHKNSQIVDLQRQINEIQEKIRNDASMSTLTSRVDEITKSITQATLEKEKIMTKVRALEFSKELVERNSAQLAGDKANMHKEILEV